MSYNLKTNFFGDLEVYVVVAYEWDPDRPREHQAPERTCYCVCDSYQSARAVIANDTREGRITQPSIQSHVIQSKEHVLVG